MAFDKLDQNLVRSFNERGFQRAPPNQNRLLEYLHAIIPQPLEHQVQIVAAQRKVIDGVSLW